MPGRTSQRLRDRSRLPNLAEILNRKTQTPVDLWSFYVFMREQYRAVEYLDFWLDVVQHLSLCRHYVRGLRMSIMASSEHRTSSRNSSVLLDTLIQEGTLDDTDSHRLSMFLRGEDSTGTGALYRLSALLDAMALKDQGLEDLHNSNLSRSEKFAQLVDRHSSADQEKLLTRPNTYGHETDSQLYGDGRDSSSPSVSQYNTAMTENAHAGIQPQAQSYELSSPSTGQDKPTLLSGPPGGPVTTESEKFYPTNGYAVTSGPGGVVLAPNAADAIERLFPKRENDINDGKNFVTRHDIRQSSNRILVTYFIPGAERELQLPVHITKAVKNAIEVDGRDDPEVFDQAREYVFQAMERDALPGFLASRALGNTSPGGSLIRLIIGLISLFAAFWIGFILIFLDWKPKATRCWLILPFGIAMYMILASLYNLDPILALMGYTESPQKTLFSQRIKEPYVRRLLIKRSLYVLWVIIICAAIFVIIFALVPGKRL